MIDEVEEIMDEEEYVINRRVVFAASDTVEGKDRDLSAFLMAAAAEKLTQLGMSEDYMHACQLNKNRPLSEGGPVLEAGSFVVALFNGGDGDCNNNYYMFAKKVLVYKPGMVENIPEKIKQVADYAHQILNSDRLNLLPTESAQDIGKESCVYRARIRIRY